MRFFPDDAKELLSIYSNLLSNQRDILLEISHTIKKHQTGEN